MPVIREKKNYITQPVGVVRAGADTFGVSTGIGDLADTLITNSYNDLVAQAKKRGEDVARTISETRFKSLNPTTGQLEVLQPPSTFGTAAANAYQSLIERRYVASIESDITNKAKVYAVQFENSVDGYSKFKSSLDEDVQSIVDNTDPRFRDLAQSMGSSLAASYESNFLQKEIQRNIANTVNATIVDLDKQATNISQTITTQDFSLFNTETGQNELAENTELIQGLLDSTSIIAHETYLINPDEKILTSTIDNTLSKVGIAYGEALIKEISRHAEENSEGNTVSLTEDIALVSLALRHGKDFPAELRPELKALVDQVLSLTVNTRDIDENGEYQEGISKQNVYPLISQSIQTTLNQTTPEFRTLEAIHNQGIQDAENRRNLITENSINDEHKVLKSNAAEQIANLAPSGDWKAIMTLIEDTVNQSTELLKTANNEGKILKSPTEIRADSQDLKRNLLNYALNNVGFIGAPTTISDGVSARTRSFNLSESNSILRFAQTNNPDHLPEQIRQPILDVLEFAGEDRIYALNTLTSQANNVVQGFQQSQQEIQNINTVNDINQGTARPDLQTNRELFDSNIVLPMLENLGIPDIDTGGNVFLRSDYADYQSDVIQKMSETNMVSESLIKAYSGVMSGSITNETQIFNVMSTMLALDRSKDAVGNDRNILQKSLKDNDYAMFNAIKDAVSLEGTSSLPNIIGKLRSADVNSIEFKRNKIAVFQSFVQDNLPDGNSNFSKLSEQNQNQLILDAAFFRNGITDVMVRADMANRLDGYIDYHVAVNGNADAFSNFVGVMFDKYYQTNDGLIVDPANPNMDRSVYSLRNKAVGITPESRIKTASIINEMMKEQGFTNGMVIAQDEFLPSAVRGVIGSNLLIGESTVEKVEDITFGEGSPFRRVYLMPFANDPYGESFYTRRDSEGPIFTENTVYTAVTKEPDGSFIPYIVDGKVFSISYKEIHDKVFEESNEQERIALEKNYQLSRIIQEDTTLDFLPETLGNIAREQIFNMMSFD